MVLLQSTSATSAYLPWPRLVQRTVQCIQSNSTGSTRPDVGVAAKFRRQWNDHVKLSAACITSTRAVTQCFRTCTEDAPVLDRPAPLRRFCTILAPNKNAPTYVLTCAAIQILNFHRRCFSSRTNRLQVCKDIQIFNSTVNASTVKQ